MGPSRSIKGQNPLTCWAVAPRRGFWRPFVASHYRLPFPQTRGRPLPLIDPAPPSLTICFICRSFTRKTRIRSPRELCASVAVMARVLRHARVFSSRKSAPYTLVLTVLLLLSVVLLMLLGLGIFSLPVDSNDSPNGTRRADREISNTDGMTKRGKQWTELLSWEPRAFIYHNFLSKEECEHLIELGKPYMAKSTVVDSSTGKSKDSRVRTSSGTFLSRGLDKTVKAIEKRIADFTFIPVEHGEGLQILHYEVGQKYEPHYDYFLDEFNTKNGGQRIATLLMYLSDVEEGGETVFPAAKINSSALPWYDELSECGKKGLSVRPKMGDALLFWSMKPDATLDPSSLHGGCPVIKGNKWSSTKWMHINEYKV